MLKRLIEKILGFFVVAIGGKDYGVLREDTKTPDASALPVINGVVIGRDVKSVGDIRAPGYHVDIVYGRPVYVPVSYTEENGVPVYTTDLASARYCTYTIDYENRTPRNNPRHTIIRLDEPLSEKTHDALVAAHEYDLQKYAESAAAGDPPGFISRLIRLYPPHPKEAAALPQATTDQPQP